MAINLTPAAGWLFRITHRVNLPWLLVHGLNCAKCGSSDPNFVTIGNPDLIAKRQMRPVPLEPYGTLADYIPFYFTPKSPMLYNISTGYGGITRRLNNDIIVLASTIKNMKECGVSLLFTDRHAYTATALWSNNPDELGHLIDWDILRRGDFARDDNYPDKLERYQAEALAYSHVPPGALRGIGCASDSIKPALEADIQQAGLALSVAVQPGWYFQ